VAVLLDEPKYESVDVGGCAVVLYSTPSNRQCVQWKVVEVLYHGSAAAAASLHCWYQCSLVMLCIYYTCFDPLLVAWCSVARSLRVGGPHAGQKPHSVRACCFIGGTSGMSPQLHYVLHDRSEETAGMWSGRFCFAWYEFTSTGSWLRTMYLCSVSLT